MNWLNTAGKTNPIIIVSSQLARWSPGGLGSYEFPLPGETKRTARGRGFVQVEFAFPA